jgi:hypothetical protein
MMETSEFGINWLQIIHIEINIMKFLVPRQRIVNLFPEMLRINVLYPLLHCEKCFFIISDTGEIIDWNFSHFHTQVRNHNYETKIL